MNKKLLIFDAYGTIFSTGNGSITAVKKILSLQPEEIDADTFYADWKSYHRENMNRSNCGSFITEEEVFTKDLEQLYKQYNIKRNYVDDVKIMLQSLYGRQCFDDSRNVIDTLRKHYRVVIGSTTDTAPFLENMSINKLEVDAVYTSELIGKYKPDSAFYEYILDKENCVPVDAVFIGDSLTDDIFGPQQLGIETILLDRKQKYNMDNADIVPEHIISSLTELFFLL